MTSAGDHYGLVVGAHLGMTVGIVAERYWGGVCLNTGCVPSKALLRNAEIAAIVTHQNAIIFTTRCSDWIDAHVRGHR